jgi:hypothetical protein
LCQKVQLERISCMKWLDATYGSICGGLDLKNRDINFSWKAS